MSNANGENWNVHNLIDLSLLGIRGYLNYRSVGQDLMFSVFIQNKRK